MTLAEFCHKAVGVPFLDGGRDYRGLDCWGCVALCYRECLGIELPGYGEISASDLLRVRRKIAEGSSSDAWRKVAPHEPLDVAVMRLPNGRAHGHVGIVVDAQHVLHAEAGSGVAIERIDTPTIRNRLLGFWRYNAG